VCPSQCSSHVGRGLGDDFAFREALGLFSLAVRGGRGRGAGLKVGEEEFALLELRAVGVVFGCELGFAEL